VDWQAGTDLNTPPGRAKTQDVRQHSRSIPATGSMEKQNLFGFCFFIQTIKAGSNP